MVTRTKKVEARESPQEAVLIQLFAELIVSDGINLTSLVKRAGDKPATTALEFTVSIDNACFTSVGLKRLNTLATELDKKSSPKKTKR